MKINKVQRPLTITLNSKNEIKYACQGPPLNEHLEPGDTVVNGEIAELLYLSIAGHTFEEHPDEADKSRAIGARWRLCSFETARVAHMALIQFGHRIKPWFGSTPIDSDGHPVVNAEQHDLEIPLDIPVTAPVIMRMVVV